MLRNYGATWKAILHGKVQYQVYKELKSVNKNAVRHVQEPHMLAHFSIPFYCIISR